MAPVEDDGDEHPGTTSEADLRLEDLASSSCELVQARGGQTDEEATGHEHEADSEQRLANDGDHCNQESAASHGHGLEAGEAPLPRRDEEAKEGQGRAETPAGAKEEDDWLDSIMTSCMPNGSKEEKTAEDAEQENQKEEDRADDETEEKTGDVEVQQEEAKQETPSGETRHEREEVEKEDLQEEAKQEDQSGESEAELEDKEIEEVKQEEQSRETEVGLEQKEAESEANEEGNGNGEEVQSEVQVKEEDRSGEGRLQRDNSDTAALDDSELVQMEASQQLANGVEEQENGHDCAEDSRLEQDKPGALCLGVDSEPVQAEAMEQEDDEVEDEGKAEKASPPGKLSEQQLAPFLGRIGEDQSKAAEEQAEEDEERFEEDVQQASEEQAKKEAEENVQQDEPEPGPDADNVEAAPEEEEREKVKVADAALANAAKPAAKSDAAAAEEKPRAAAANAADRAASSSKRRVWRGGSSSGQSRTQVGERPTAAATKGTDKGNGKGSNARTWGNKRPPFFAASEARDAARSPSRGNRASRKEAAKPTAAATAEAAATAAQQQQQQRSLPQRSEAATQRSRSSGQPLNRQRRDAEDEVEVRVWRPSYVPEAKSAASRRARTPEVSSGRRAATPERSRRKQDASKRSNSATAQEKLPEMGWSPSLEVGRSWGSSGAANSEAVRSATPDRATARAATGRASSVRSRASKPASFNARVPRPAG